MKRAAAAFGHLITATTTNVGLEGAFLLVGTICLAVGAAIVWGAPAPWFVVGGMSIVVGFALTLPRTR